MKIIKFFAFLVIPLILGISVSFVYNPNIALIFMKNFLVREFNKIGINTKIQNIKIKQIDKSNYIVLSGIEINTIGKFFSSDNELKVRFNPKKLITHGNFNIESLIKLKGINHDQNIQIKYTLNSNITFSKIEQNILVDFDTQFQKNSDKISLNHNLEINLLKKSGIFQKATCQITQKDNVNLYLNAYLNNYGNYNLNISGKDNSIKKISHILKYLEFLEIYEFLKNYKISGNIKNIDIKGLINKNKLNKILTGKNLNINNISSIFSGKIFIENGVYQIDKDFPLINKINAEAKINKGMINMIFHSGYLNNTRINNAQLFYDLTKSEENAISIMGQAKGDVKDLFGFVSKDIIQNLNQNDIKLHNIEGKALTKFDITIPLGKNEPNIYDISSTTANSSLNLFDNQINLKNITLDGKFDGNKIVILGKTLLNNCHTKINFSTNFDDSNTKLLFKTKLDKKLDGKNYIEISKGSTESILEYNNSKNNNYLKIYSNLTNIGFNFLLPSYKKDILTKAEFNSITKFEENSSNTSVDLSIDNKKLVKGDIFCDKNRYIQDFPMFKIGKNNFSYLKTSYNNNHKIIFSGKTIDLSSCKILNLFKSGIDTKSLSLNFNIGKILLHNDINLTNAISKIKFPLIKDINKKRINLFSSKFNKHNHSILFDYDSEYNMYELYTKDASLLLKGLGLYDKLKNGEIKITIKNNYKINNDKKNNSKIKKIVENEDIVYKGKLLLKSFTLQDPPLMTNYIKLLSVNGIIQNIFSADKDIHFRSWSGNFEFTKNKILNINRNIIEGYYFDSIFEGTLDLNNYRANIKGRVIPFILGLDNIFKIVPLIGKLYKNVRPGIPFKIDHMFKVY